jgi:hypothetical protein
VRAEGAWGGAGSAGSEHESNRCAVLVGDGARIESHWMSLGSAGISPIISTAGLSTSRGCNARTNSGCVTRGLAEFERIRLSSLRHF